MDVVTLDFETYYSKDYSLSKKDCTTQSYIDDARFEVIGVAAKVNNGPVEWCSGTHEEIKKWLLQFDWKNSALLAHNCLFDGSILAWRFGIYPKLLLDTLSMARALHGVDAGGSLEALAVRYGIGEKGTAVHTAIGKYRLDFNKKELAEYASYCCNDVFLTYCLFQIMFPKFNRVEIELIDLTLKMHTTPQLHLDISVLEQHLQDVQAKKRELLGAARFDKADLMSNNKLAEVLETLGVPPPKKISARTGKETFAFSKSDEEFKALLEHDDPLVQAVVAARLGVKSTLEETRTERFIKIADSGGMLPVPLKYYGALTGRWAAIDSINLQNIPRSSPLKKAIIAPPGYVIVGADLSNIELRVGLYFAGQLNKLKMLGEGLDLYKDFAASAFKVRYDDVTDSQRFVGKTAQLSLVYGTGHKKLRSQIKMLSGNDIGEEFAQRVVEQYREDYSDVVRAWRNAGRVLEAIVENETMGMGLGPLELDVHGTDGIKLPSGLYLQYPELEKFTDEETGREQYKYKTRRGVTYIHPAKCFQNVIQALARCVMGEAMVRTKKKYRSALTIHDALYCVVPEEQAEQARRDIILELRKPPKWMPGIPLDAEGGYGENLSFKMRKLEQ